MATTHGTTPLTELLRSLRSVRRFAPERIPDEVLADILEVGRWTGSAKNRQPWELVVVEERPTLVALSKSGDFAGHLAGAALAIALLMSGSQGRSLAVDEGRLAQNLMLAAWAHGVGSCIATVWSDRAAAALEALGAPADRTLGTILSLGYPESPGARFLSATPALLAVAPVGRRPLGELVSYERYGSVERRAAT